MGLADHNTLVYVEAGGGKLIIGNSNGKYVEITVNTSGNLVVTDDDGNAAVIVTSNGNLTPS